MKTWNDCVTFHGHECGGLTIGYKASLYAIDLLELAFSDNEQVVCITENDACGVDAIQVMLGCSIGKGNLLFHMCGKQAYSFYNRKNGKSVRLVLKPKPEGMTKEELFAYYQSCKPEEMFDVKETTVRLEGERPSLEAGAPEEAKEEATVEDAAAYAMIESLGDRWSYYMDKETYAEYMMQMANSYVGIGVTVTQAEDGYVHVLRVEAGGVLKLGEFLDVDNGGTVERRAVTNLVLMGMGEPLDNTLILQRVEGTGAIDK